MGATSTTTTKATADIITTTTTTNTATTPTTSALLNESRQLLLKQQLKLNLNINVSEMMDNIRRNVDEQKQSSHNINSNNGHDGECDRQRDRNSVEKQQEDNLEGHKTNGFRRGLNELDTVTTVPQLQQKFNKFNIADEAAITTNTITTTESTKTCVAAAKSSTTTSSSSSFLLNKSLTQQKQQPQNTALAKFNRIIDNTVPVINTYNYQRHVAETLAKSLQQHPHYQYEPQQQQLVEMPILSDSLQRRLANNRHQYYHTDLIVNNSKVNFSSPTVTATATPKQAAVVASTSTVATAATLAMLATASSSQQEQESKTKTKMSFDEDDQLERNDVHYLLKQLNSFSDIEEIEIVDIKQKQRQLQQQQQYNKEKNYIKENNQQQYEEKVTSLNFKEHQYVESIKQQYEYIVDTTMSQEHVSTDQSPLVSQSDLHIENLKQQVAVDMQTNTTESKQHYQTTATTSPTATSLVMYSPSSQSHKGIRRYASQDEHSTATYHPHHHQPHSHYIHLPHEHYSEGSMENSAAAQATATDPLILQQFVDDYIFQSCHYLETNNFVANYRTAMVETSSHEFRPSTTDTTRTSNEEFYEEEATGYTEDHSSAHSFELHETEPPTVICKAPAPLKCSISSTQQQKTHHNQKQQLYTMETRLCSSGVQTDLTASSLAQSFSLSSSLSSSEKRKHRQPLFKCCYTPLDRWREKRSLQQRTKSAKTIAVVNTIENLNKQQLKPPQITNKNTSISVVGGPSNVGCSSAILNRTIATTATTTTTTSTLVVQPTSYHHHHHHQQHYNQSLTKTNNKNNAPYAV